jgi:hypothetical protein
MRVPRPLDAVEIRVLGCLLEKQQTTPEYYPMTLNALVAACNQRSNRDPVMELSGTDVRAALQRLRDDVLVWSAQGARSERFEHNLDRRLELDAPAKAVVTELLLRGAQTVGELRSRSGRAYSWGTLVEVEETLRRLAAGPEPLVVEVLRRPGQKEARWAHVLGGDLAAGSPAVDSVRDAGSLPGGTLADRVTALEARLDELVSEVERLAEKLREGD